MTYLIIHVLALVAFGQSLRVGQKCFGKIIGISAVNYLVAAGLSVSMAVVLCLQDYSGVGWPLAAIGLGNGVCYFLCLVVMLIGYEIVGIGITSAVVSCGMIIPVLTAWLLGWEPRLLLSQWLALALLPPALWWMRPLSRRPKTIDWQANLILLAAFLLPGVMTTLHTWAARLTGDDLSAKAVYTAAIFVGALIGTAVIAVRRRERVTGGALGLGVWIGVVNVLATLMLMFALRRLGAAVFFSTSGPAVIVLHLIISRLVWKERLIRRQIFGLCLALLVIVLANIAR